MIQCTDMKRQIILTAAALAALTATAKTSTPRGFTDDFDGALARAKAENKTVVAAFSGSDWCGWCKRLEKEVFSKRAFLQEATNRYVLVYIDRPSDESLLSAHAAKQNPQLIEKYGIQGFPTVLLMDGDGKVLDKMGYERGGPENYLKLIESTLAALPYVAEWIEPMTQRFDAVYKELNRGGKTALKLDGVRRADEVKPHFTRAADALEKLIAEERAKDVPAPVKAKRAALLDEQAEIVQEFRKIAATPSEELLRKMR